MSKNEDDPAPYHSEHSQPILRSFFIVVFGLGLVVTPIPARSADITFKDSQSRLVSITERFVGFPAVEFDVDSMTLDDEAQQDLYLIIRHIKAHPNGRVRLEGHVDERYSQAYGQVLSGKMADVVRKYLQGHEVKNRIRTTGYGNARPLCREHNEECWCRSNRVEVLVFDREGASALPVPMSADSNGSSPQSTGMAPTFEFPTVYFQRNSSQLDRKARASLAPLIEHLKSRPDLQIQLNGHVDETHTQAYGFTLSSKRAESVKKYLVERGVKNGITIQAWGKERPVCFEHNEACYRLSNQVDIIKY